MRVRRALASAAGLAAALVVAVGIAGSRRVDLPAARIALVDAVRARTGAQLRIDALSTGWLPPRIVLERPALAMDAPGAPALLSADRVALGLAPFAVLGGTAPARAIRHVTVSGDTLHGSGDVAADGSLALDLVLDGLDAVALGPALVALGGERGAPAVRIAAGRVSGTLRLALAPGAASRIDAALVLDDADLVVEEASVRGTVRLEVAWVDAPDARWSGTFDADVADAVVERGALRKLAGRPTRVSGRLALRPGVDGVELTDLRIAPLSLDLVVGEGPPIEIHVDGARTTRGAASPEEAP